MSDLPIEIWQTILRFCDDASVKTVDENFPGLIDSKDPTWRAECWKLRRDFAIPDAIFHANVAGKVNFLQILLHKPFMANLIGSSKLFAENIMAIHTNSHFLSYQSHDRSTHGIITYRFPLNALGVSHDLLMGSFRLSFDFDISTQLDRFVHLEMKTIARTIDDGEFYGDEIENIVDPQCSLHRLRPFSNRTFSIDFSPTVDLQNPVEDQELSIRLGIPHGVSIRNIRLSWTSKLISPIVEKEDVLQ